MFSSARFFLFLILAWTALAIPHAHAEIDATEANYLERALNSCNGEPVCVAHVRKLQAKEADKRKLAAQDEALKLHDPTAYYVTLTGRFLLFGLFVCLAAGGYVLLMRLLFKDKK